jgi:phosphoglycolate phosphatase-like HAD superfamily hydrolase
MTDNQPQKQPKAVIFDLDGTLINDKGMMRDFSHDVVDKFDNNAGQEPSEKSFIGVRKLVEKCFRNFSDQTPKDSAIELLQHLKAQNIP